MLRLQGTSKVGIVILLRTTSVKLPVQDVDVYGCIALIIAEVKSRNAAENHGFGLSQDGYGCNASEH